MAKTKSPAKGALPKKGRSPSAALTTRASPRKSSPTKDAKPTASESPKRVTKTSPAKALPVKDRRPAIATVPSMGKKRAASRSASPAKPAKKSASTCTGARKRGPIDEDDADYDPDEPLQEIMDEIGDKRRLTKWDKDLIDWIERLETGSATLTNQKYILDQAESEGDLNCHYKIYWRFQALYKQKGGRRTVPSDGDEDESLDWNGDPAYQIREQAPSDDYVESIEQQPARRGRPPKNSPARQSPGKGATRGPSRSPAKQSPAKSPSKLGKTPVLERPVRGKSSSPSHPIAKVKSPVQSGRIVRRSQSPARKSAYNQKLAQIQEEARYDTQQDYPLEPYNRLDEEWKSQITPSVYRSTQQAGIDQAQSEPRGTKRQGNPLAKTQNTLRKLADGSEQRGIRHFEKRQIDERNIVLPQPSTRRGASKSPGPKSTVRPSPQSAASPGTRHARFAKKTASPSPGPKSPGKTISKSRVTPAATSIAAQQKQIPPPPTRSSPDSDDETDDYASEAYPDEKGRGMVCPLVHARKVHVTLTRGDKPDVRVNTFYETMPAPEVWYRNMAPFLPFGETKFQEQYQSDQINRDLARSESQRQTEKQEAATAAAAIAETTQKSKSKSKSKSPTLFGTLKGALGFGSTATTTTTTTPKKPRNKSPIKEKFNDEDDLLILLRPSPFDLPRVSDAEVDEIIDLVEKSEGGGVSRG